MQRLRRDPFEAAIKRYLDARFKLVCDPRVSDGEMRSISQALAPYPVAISQQCAAVEITTGGAIILFIAFASRSFFTAFLSELGKDAYGWLKAQVVARQHKLRVAYSIKIGELMVTAVSDHRLSSNSCDTLLVVGYALSKCTQPIEEIELEYDSRKRRYVCAHAYRAGVPCQTISLPSSSAIVDALAAEPNSPLHLTARLARRARRKKLSPRRR